MIVPTDRKICLIVNNLATDCRSLSNFGSGAIWLREKAELKFAVDQIQDGGSDQIENDYCHYYNIIKLFQLAYCRIALKFTRFLIYGATASDPGLQINGRTGVGVLRQKFGQNAQN